MNPILNATRQTILDRQGISEDDLYVRALRLAKLKEEAYFSPIM